jgi:SAM-dependent methyltransferase
MTPADARALIAHPSLSAGGAQVWADLGCGDGTFTVALASLLPAGSTVHAIDKDTRALARIPARQGDVAIMVHDRDFIGIPGGFAPAAPPTRSLVGPHDPHSVRAARSRDSLAGWPFDDLQGVLMANSLHYVREQAAFLRGVDAALRRRRMLLVEYDITRGNVWVPYPIGQAAAVELFRSIGYGVATPLGRRRSVFRRGEIYGLLLTP